MGAATPSPSGSSPTITDDAPAADAVAEPERLPLPIGPDWELIERIDRDFAERKAAKEAVETAKRAAAEADAAKSTPLLSDDWSTAPPPIEPPAATPNSPDPVFQHIPVGTAGPPEAEPASPLLIGGAIVGAFLLLVGLRWAERSNLSFSAAAARAWLTFASWRRRNCALLIAAGLAIVAASFTVAKPSALPYEIRDYVSDGWLAFLGAIVAIMGVYDKLSSPPRDGI